MQIENSRTKINANNSEKENPCDEWVFTPRYQQKKITVFVSSTFKDMKKERDELALRIFPELRKICEDREIAWNEIDLRWGIPDERNGIVLNTCLKCIEECRPYFIGILGERYGWVENNIPDNLINEYPWLSNHEEKSITELEILHGVLNNPEMATHSYFYFRDPKYLDTLPINQKFEYVEQPIQEEILKYGSDEANRRTNERRNHLATLKIKIRNSGFPVRENYTNPIKFGELVKEDLLRVIDTIAPISQQSINIDPNVARLQREERIHEGFAASRYGVYIPRKEDFSQLDDYATNGGEAALGIFGDSGIGKSALLAHWAFQYQEKHPDDFVLIHFVGASSDSTDIISMISRFEWEIKRRYHVSDMVPETDEAIITSFAYWLNIAAKQDRIILIIDALNQLNDQKGALDLIWLPTKIPKNVRLILSTIPGRPLDAIRKRGWHEIEIKPLSKSERDLLISCYLRKYRKELDAPIREELANAELGDNPLFLRTLLEEIRIHGEFEKLPDQIREYLEVRTIDALFEMILARYERDYERDCPCLVKDTTSILWAARYGLSKPEIMDILGSEKKPLPDTYSVPLFLAMKHSLVTKDGLITFFHEYLRKAIENRYLPSIELKQTAHLKIAKYFLNQPDSKRRTVELPWQLAQAKDWGTLVALLSTPTFLLHCWNESQDDVKRYWVQIETESPFTMCEVYRPAIREPTHTHYSMILVLSSLFYQTGHLEDAKRLGEYLIHSSKEQKDKLALQEFFGNQALILRDQGDNKNAMKILKKQERICHELNHLDGLLNCLVNQATILFINGDLDNAMDLYKQAKKICHEIGNRNALQTIIGNQALILRDQGNLQEAMAYHEEEERICRDLGNADGLQASLKNQATIHLLQGDNDNAMELYKRAEDICREFGNLRGLHIALGNEGIILMRRGDLDGAMRLQKEVEKICLDLKDKLGLQRSFGNQALILGSQHDFNKAMIFLRKQESICRESGYCKDLANSLTNQALIHLVYKNQFEAQALLIQAYNLAKKHGHTLLAQNIFSIWLESAK